MLLGHNVIAEAPFLQCARLEVLHHHVIARHQAAHDVAAFIRLEVDGDGLLVAVHRGPPQALALKMAADCTQRIAGWRLHLDHLGAEIGEQATAEWAGNGGAEFEDPNALQGPAGDVGVRHRAPARRKAGQFRRYPRSPPGSVPHPPLG